MDCNEQVESTLITVEKALKKYGNFHADVSVMMAFMSINQFCQANKKGIYCPRGGRDFIDAKFLEIYRLLEQEERRLKKKMAQWVKLVVKKYW